MRPQPKYKKKKKKRDFFSSLLFVLTFPVHHNIVHQPHYIPPSSLYTYSAASMDVYIFSTLAVDSFYIGFALLYLYSN